MTPSCHGCGLTAAATDGGDHHMPVCSWVGDTPTIILTSVFLYIS